jgi:hypothetical protein
MAKLSLSSILPAYFSTESYLLPGNQVLDQAYGADSKAEQQSFLDLIIKQRFNPIEFGG